MDRASLYDDDILAWSVQQAEALRRLAARPDLPNELDLAHVADEIAELGQDELRDVRVLLGKALARLVVGWAAPALEPASTWAVSVVGWLGEAALRITPAMRDCLDLADLWHGAVRQAVQRLEIEEMPEPARQAARLTGTECPFALDLLLGDDFRIVDALARLDGVEPPAAFP